VSQFHLTVADVFALKEFLPELDKPRIAGVRERRQACKVVIEACTAVNRQYTHLYLLINMVDANEKRIIDEAIFVLFCSLAVLDPRVGDTIDVLFPFVRPLSF